MSSIDNQDRIDAFVAEVQEGDADAFESLYEMFFPRIYKYVFYKAQQQDVDDLVAQVFIKAWSKISTYKKTDHRFSSWLFRIAHNTVIDYYRTHKPTEELAEYLPNENRELDPLHKVNQVFASERVHRALRTLEDKYQQVILLKFLQDLPNGEIADVMGVKETSVRTLQFRALKQLRSLLEEEDLRVKKRLEPEETADKKTGLLSLKRWFFR